MRRFEERTDQRYFFLTNDRRFPKLSGRLDELHPDKSEEKKLESVLSTISVLTQQNWICIKEDTDGLTIDHLRQLIFESICGTSTNEIIDEDIQQRLDNFQISISDSEYESQNSHN